MAWPDYGCRTTCCTTGGSLPAPRPPSTPGRVSSPGGAWGMDRAGNLVGSRPLLHDDFPRAEDPESSGARGAGSPPTPLETIEAAGVRGRR